MAEIGEWIALDDPDAANRFVADLVAGAAQIRDMPRAFPVFLRLNGREIRKRVHRRYAIFFTLSRDTVQVLRIVHGKRDLSALFKS